MQPGLSATLAVDVQHFITPSEEVIVEEEEVTLELLVDQYLPPAIPEKVTLKYHIEFGEMKLERLYPCSSYTIPNPGL